jgi:hypothetical protein
MDAMKPKKQVLESRLVTLWAIVDDEGEVIAMGTREGQMTSILDPKLPYHVVRCEGSVEVVRG